MTFYEKLVAKLEPLYQTPYVPGGHTAVHVRGVERLGYQIFPHMPDVDPVEFRVTAWLHNVDRCPLLKDEIVASGGVSGYIHDLLRDSPFTEESRHRIVDTVVHHGKRDDDLVNDSPLLTAIRIADKLDRLTPLNLMAGPTHRPYLPHYDVNQPFGYKTNSDCHLKFFLWNVEWYAMLPYDWARELVDEDFFRLFLTYIRQLGRNIAHRHLTSNEIEEDLRTALGPHYEKWRL